MKFPDIRKIDIRSPKIQAMIGIIIASIVCIFLWYHYVFVGKIEKRKELDSTLTIKQNELARINSMMPHLSRLHEDMKQLQVQLDSLRSIFPDKKEIPKLIREITKVASSSGVFTNKFNPLQDVIREYYTENKYHMSVIGGYHELATFFSHLAEFELIINLSNVTIRMNPGVAGSISEYDVHGGTILTVVATFTMTTFSSKK